VSKSKVDREDELKANLHSLTLDDDKMVDTSADSLPEQEEESTFRIEDIPPSLTLPQARFNASLAVGMDDKLYVYGGTFEVPGRGEITLDDFHVIDLNKLDGVRELWSRTVIPTDQEEDGDDDEEWDSDKSSTEEIDTEIATSTTKETEEIEENMGIDVSRTISLAETKEADEKMDIDIQGTAETKVTNIPEEELVSSFNPAYPTPLPFESLKSYYDRTAREWLEICESGKSKAGRREAFVKAEGYWWECREEVRNLEEQMEESGVNEVVVSQADRKEKRR